MGTEGARALLERAATLTLQTGNLLSWGCLRKKCPATPAEEVSGAGRAPGLPLRALRRRGAGGSCRGRCGAAERYPEWGLGLGFIFFYRRRGGERASFALTAASAVPAGACGGAPRGGRRLPALGAQAGASLAGGSAPPPAPPGAACCARGSEETGPPLCSRGTRNGSACKLKCCLWWQRRSLMLPLAKRKI